MRQAVADSPARTLRLPEDPAARLAFSDRSVGNVSFTVGDGDVTAARARLVGLVGVGPEQAVFMEQVHGARVAVVGRADRGRGAARGDTAVARTDALVTREADIALVVLVADCVPVLLVDPGRAVGAVHAGRRGILAGVVGASVEAIGDDPSRLVAVIGPAIGSCCYELPDELVDAVATVIPTARASTRWGTPSLDLPAAVVHQLAVAGVDTVREAGSCTRCEGDRWYSHRRGSTADSGRQAGVVCRRGAPSSVSRLPGPGDRVA